MNLCAVGKGKFRTLQMFVKLGVKIIAKGQQMGGVDGNLL